ncbi:uncharacterized protein I303_105272 [Kwoniella dejecticola CBS 10117]|uniref:Calpain catalytic domain-containing protein n=1 Tax=Kwoniella dejecticola CBS 10117 TaxID=1296121 RepID=A0A1A6A2Y2_9TREE|nr:uncharacterized protein I303_05280 [Kwoniella dejecticola CBS 10117]OBR84422.1 hypothetical protein I303_05280 [Kwoniella dejecticola CBS 10117]
MIFPRLSILLLLQLGFIPTAVLSKPIIDLGDRHEDVIAKMKRWEGQGEYDDNGKPKPEDIWQGPANDWFLCGLASLAKIDPTNVHNGKASAWGHVDQNHDDIKTKRQMVDAATIELYHIDDEKFVSATAKYGEMTNHNSISGDPWYWWPGAYEKAAMKIGGNEWVNNEGFWGGANASVGLKMLTGLEAEDIELDPQVTDIGYPQVNQDYRTLEEGLRLASTTPVCVWAWGRYFSVLEYDAPQEVCGSHSVDVLEQYPVKLYDTRKGKTDDVDFCTLVKEVTWISKLKTPLGGASEDDKTKAWEESN